MRTFRFLMVLVLLSLGIVFPHEKTFALVELQAQDEVPQEFTEAEYQQSIKEFYEQYKDFVVVVDLKDPNGIDPELLPDDIASVVDANTKVLAYKETINPTSNSEQNSRFAAFCNSLLGDILLDISCADPDGSRDTTVTDIYGGVTQYSRVLALRYDEYEGCDRLCHGREFEKQWAKWQRTNSSWSIGDISARMGTTATSASNFCTQGFALLNKYSTFFTPTWNGNNTSWYSISGFPNLAYVPSPPAVSFTQGDVYQSGALHTDDAMTTQSFPNI